MGNKQFFLPLVIMLATVSWATLLPQNTGQFLSLHIYEIFPFIVWKKSWKLPSWLNTASCTTTAESCTISLLKPIFRHCKLERFLKGKCLYSNICIFTTIPFITWVKLSFAEGFLENVVLDDKLTPLLKFCLWMWTQCQKEREELKQNHFCTLLYCKMYGE